MDISEIHLQDKKIEEESTKKLVNNDEYCSKQLLATEDTGSKKENENEVSCEKNKIYEEENDKNSDSSNSDVKIETLVSEDLKSCNTNNAAETRENINENVGAPSSDKTALSDITDNIPQDSTENTPKTELNVDISKPEVSNNQEHTQNSTTDIDENPVSNKSGSHGETSDAELYTDPNTGYEYVWNRDSQEWALKNNDNYGFEDGTHTFVDKDGTKYFWDKEKSAWFPKIDDDFMAMYQLNYGFIDNSQSSSKEPEKTEVPANEIKPNELKRKIQKEPEWFEVDDQHNTNVYVSNLPLDITEQEFVDLMQKYGLVMRDPTSGKMKVKLYKEKDTDVLKGDGLCTYIKKESVDLALNLLDGYVYKGNKIKVERAKFQMKGNYDPTLKPKRKKKEKEKLKKMQERLFDWRPDKLRGQRAKHEKVVIIKNAFEPSMFDQDVGLILEIQKDLREECSKCGEVRKVVLFDRHPDGVVQVNMKSAEEADEVVNLINGRWYNKRKLSAQIWDGKTKYRIAETDSEISKRLNKWDKFLEGEEDPDQKPKDSKEET